MSQKVQVECHSCGWSAIIDMSRFEHRCPNGHRIEYVSPVTRP